MIAKRTSFIQQVGSYREYRKAREHVCALMVRGEDAVIETADCDEVSSEPALTLELDWDLVEEATAA